MAAFTSVSSQRAEGHIREAEKTLKKWSFFGSSDDKYEDAADLFEKAANCYKKEKMYREAAGAYLRSADCHKKLKSNHELCATLVKAADMMSKDNVPEGIQLYEQAVEIYLEQGKFATGAKYQQEVAKLHAQEQNFEEALEAYGKAAEYYDGDGNAASRRDACLEQVATLCGEKDVRRYDKAAEIFEQLGVAATEVALKKFSARKLFMHCVLCHLARPDVVGARQAVEKAKSTDYTFEACREGELCEALVSATEQYDTDAFGQAAKVFDDISKFSPWQVSVLYNAKQAIEGGGAPGDDQGDPAGGADGVATDAFAPDMTDADLC